MTTQSTYKPSPLSFGSPRTSPFRRPDSPATQLRRADSPSSPSTAIRPTTPTFSPTKIALPRSPSPSKLQDATTPTSESGTWTPHNLNTSSNPFDDPVSPTRTSSTTTAVTVMQQSWSAEKPSLINDPISKLPASQVREMREGFQILDRDNDGLVNRDDIVDMLKNLGQPASASDVTPFFPPGAPQAMPLPIFLNSLAGLLTPLSGQQELLNAFAAFDEQDGGDIDVGELRDALLNTAREAGEKTLSGRNVDEVLGGFTGRKVFGKGTAAGSRGEVFRYRDWVAGLTGTAGEKNDAEK